MTWDAIYRDKGEVQKKPYQVVVASVPIFQKQGARRVLDLGCGTGRHALFYAKNGFEVYACDISQHGLNIIRQHNLSNIKLKRAEMSSLPYEDSFFDAIVCTSVINHSRIAKIKKTFDEIQRVLKPGGILVLVVLSPKDFTAKTGHEIEPGTRIGIADWDSDVPHHFFTKKELVGFLKDFRLTAFRETSIRSERLDRQRYHFNVIAVKN